MSTNTAKFNAGGRDAHRHEQRHQYKPHQCKLLVKDIELNYPDFHLKVESFGMRPGEIVALIGPSGSGKSTLLNCMAGLENFETGKVLLDGEPLTRSQVRKNIATVFQTPYLFKGNVAYNVSYGMRMRKLPKSEIKSRTAEALKLVGLKGWERRSILGLSGGEAQRVALARGLVLNPQVMLLDEPLSSLDEAMRKSLSKEFAEILRSQKVTVLYVTHSKQEAFTVADKITVMREGRIVASDAPEALFNEESDPWLKDFLAPDDWWLRLNLNKVPTRESSTDSDTPISETLSSNMRRE